MDKAALDKAFLDRIVQSVEGIDSVLNDIPATVFMATTDLGIRRPKKKFKHVNLREKYKLPPESRRGIAPVLRPNPDWEEDLLQSTWMEPADEARVRAYPLVKQKPRHLPCNVVDCTCKATFANPGVAPKLKLNSGKEMPAFGLGTWLGADAHGRVPVTDDSVEKAVKWAIDAGYRHIDTAAIYSTETQVGKAINNKIEEGVITRDDIFVTTKLWNDQHARSAVAPALRKSLENLNLTYVDLYLIHWPTGQHSDGSFDETDYLETWRGMQDARDQGLTRSIGVSNFNLRQLERLVNLSSEKPASLQVEINLNLQQPELLEWCRQHGVVAVAYTPFGSLFHNKAAPDAPPPRSSDRALVEIADKYSKSVPQIVLRYLTELGVVPIPKSVHKERIEKNINIFDFQLTPQERDVLKKYDRGYRTIAPTFLQGSPYYPFEKKQD